MVKKTLMPTPTDARNKAMMAISEAICGYMRLEGHHLCQRARTGEGSGCTPTSWHEMIAVIEDVLDGWEPVDAQ